MAALWEPEYKFNIWLQIEILACEAMAQKKEIPQSAIRQIKKKARFDVDRIDEIEKVVKHDVIAFLTCVSEHVGEAGRYLHLGLTSSDVLDTALAVQLRDAASLILKELIKFQAAVKKQARRQFDSWAHTYDRSIVQHLLFLPSYRLFMEALYKWRRDIADPFRNFPYKR